MVITDYQNALLLLWFIIFIEKKKTSKLSCACVWMKDSLLLMRQKRRIITSTVNGERERSKLFWG